MPYLLAAVAGFLLGSVPWALVAGKAVHGRDIRTQGSGNLGAANAFRILGPRTGIVVLLLDAAKGWGAVRLGALSGGEAAEAAAVVGGVAAVLGHVLSPWVRFRGGKGVATAAGVFLTLAPWATLLTILVWAALAALTRVASVAAMGAAVALPFTVRWVAGETGPVLWVAAGVAILVLLRHRSNMRRLMAGEETRIELFGKGKGDSRARAAGAGRGNASGEQSASGGEGGGERPRALGRGEAAAEEPQQSVGGTN